MILVTDYVRTHSCVDTVYICIEIVMTLPYLEFWLINTIAHSEVSYALIMENVH